MISMFYHYRSHSDRVDSYKSRGAGVLVAILSIVFMLANADMISSFMKVHFG